MPWSLPRILVGILALSTNQVVLSDELTAPKSVLSTVEQAMVAWVDTQQSQMVAELKSHVDINTGTDNVTGIDAYRAVLEAELQQLGFATQTIEARPQVILSCDGRPLKLANHLLAERKGKPGARRIFLNGHMDTVFSARDEFQTLQIDADGVLRGPGVADMKGGIVVMLTALRALMTEAMLEDAHITVLLNSDEEVGSLDSRALIETLAQAHDIGLVFEGTTENRMTRARKGLGQVRLKVTGRESHAGGAHADGVSANLELAHKIIAIESLTNYAQQMTVNTGVMRGGEKRNTIPGCADAYIDLRFPDQAAGEGLQAKIKTIVDSPSTSNQRFADLPHTEMWSVLHRPAKQPHPAVDALIAEIMMISASLGDAVIGTVYSGGGTDGSIAQHAGLPTVDSLGVDGGGAHSSREFSSIESLVARSKLAAIVLARQIQTAP
ncbi:hypothetical protein GCM10008090_15880 [Arenicella chitinivorans]|uniref:Peptidase M20 dimerisation domain-containing protein n=1 Tax=Arenicella chitinivorans TaxID=1329800 RepID=A0A918RQ02_9GAMM|nr:M20 family metallopeptidase [Arenicella chitinivorans]GHA07001.1 hypothetical protein GCM10008090_15880 [Arenicella chitinivorans]